MALRKQLDQKVFDDIYRKEVVEALENDLELDFQDIGKKYLQKGKCPKCGERSLYIARNQPHQLKCNRLNQCQLEEKTRERYRYLFENLSERFPKTEQNPNPTCRGCCRVWTVNGSCLSGSRRDFTSCWGSSPWNASNGHRPLPTLNVQPSSIQKSGSAHA